MWIEICATAGKPPAKAVQLSGRQFRGIIDQLEGEVPTCMHFLPDDDTCKFYTFREIRQRPTATGRTTTTHRADEQKCIIKDAIDIRTALLVVSSKPSLRMLRYQRLDRLRLMRSQGHTALLDKFTHAVRHRLPPSVRDRILVFSGCVLTTLGTTWTTDVDVMIDARGGESANWFLAGGAGLDPSILKSLPAGTEVTIYTGAGQWYAADGTPKRAYLTDWFTHQWPQLGGAQSIDDVFDTPRHHFFWCGVRFISIDLTVARLKTRARPAAMADLYALRHVNKYPITEPCLPPEVIIDSSKGQKNVYNSAGIKRARHTLARYLNEWYGLRRPVASEKASALMQVCFPHSPYQGALVSDSFTDPVKAYHTHVKQAILSQFIKKGDVVIDVGSGRLRDSGAWKAAGAAHVIAIEPSKASIEHAQADVARNASWITLLHGLGDREWATGDASDDIQKRLQFIRVFQEYPAAQVITFMFTFHYLIANKDRMSDVMTNLQRHCALGGHVVVIIMDGDYIHMLLREHVGIYTICRHTSRTRRAQDKGDVVFRITAGYDAQKIETLSSLYRHRVSVYMAGTYGLDGADVGESIISPTLLQQFFLQHGFETVYNKPLDGDAFKAMATQHGLSRDQLKISRLYRVMVFKNGRPPTSLQGDPWQAQAQANAACNAAASK